MLLTPEQYLEIERAAEHKSEYYKGQMFAMSGGTLNHSRIHHNLHESLGPQLRKKSCEMAGSDLRVQVAADGLYTYPDIVVFCGEPAYADPRRDTLTDATVIIEVLSPTTENCDRGFKFEQYRRLSSLTDYIVIAQNRVHVEHSTRQPDGSWNLRETADVQAVLKIASIDCTVVLTELYERVEFDS